MLSPDASGRKVLPRPAPGRAGITHRHSHFVKSPDSKSEPHDSRYSSPMTPMSYSLIQSPSSIDRDISRIPPPPPRSHLRSRSVQVPHSIPPMTPLPMGVLGPDDVSESRSRANSHEGDEDEKKQPPIKFASEGASLTPRESVPVTPSSRRGWEEMLDQEGNVYYYNNDTGESRWEKPSGFEPKKLNFDGKEQVSKLAKKEGLLIKRGALVKSWKERFFKVIDDHVFYYKTKKAAEDGSQPVGRIPLRGIVAKAYDEKDYGRKFCFGVASPLQKRTYVLVASSAEERDEWILVFNHLEGQIPAPSPVAEIANPWEEVRDDGKIAYKHKETQEVVTDMPIEIKQEHYNNAARLFNQNMKKGISYLQEKGLVLEDDPNSIVQFLTTAKGLSKRVVGEYFGSEKEFNIQVLKAYTDSCKFKGMTFDEALRQYLSNFRIPGEAQKIDRVMQSFAETYHRDNPTVFSCNDTAYILSFSLIMLNTDLHNPSIAASRKMTVDQFIKNNRGIDRGKDMPEEFLKSLYEEILENEIKMKDEDQHHGDAVTFLAASKEGWLKKKGERGVQKRWFLLMDNSLYYFTKPEDVKEEHPRCIYPLEDVKVSEKEEAGLIIESASGLSLKSAKRLDNGSLQAGTSKALLLIAKDPAERDEWVKAIRRSVSGDSFYGLISKRKLQMSM